MKKIILSNILIAVVGCDKSSRTNEGVTRDMIELQLLPSRNDPDSYEFVSMLHVDTVLTKEYFAQNLNMADFIKKQVDSLKGVSSNLIILNSDACKYHTVN